MKINKRVLSICLAVMLVVAMAIPASAQTIVMGRVHGDISYGTSDTCIRRSYNCIIEVWDGQTTVRTAVDMYQNNVWRDANDGVAQVDMSATSGSVNYDLSNIYCHYYLDGEYATSEWVSAS